MKLKETVILIEEKDCLDIVNGYLNSNGFKLKKINFSENTTCIEVAGSIKKVFSIEFKCSLKLIEADNNKIIFRIVDLKALKVNLFSVIEKFVSDKGYGKLKSKGIEINGKDINLSLDIIKRRMNFTAFSIKNIDVTNTGILICLNKIAIDLEKLLNFRESKKEMMKARIIK